MNIFQGTIATRKEDLGGIMLQSIQNTCIDRGQSSIQVKSPHNNTINKFINDHDLFRQQAEESTNTRHIAVYDIYNAITFAAMNHVIVPSASQSL